MAKRASRQPELIKDSAPELPTTCLVCGAAVFPSALSHHLDWHTEVAEAVNWAQGRQAMENR